MQPRGLFASLVMAGYDEGGYCLSLFLCFFFSSSCDRRRSHRRRHRSLRRLRRLSSPRLLRFKRVALGLLKFALFAVVFPGIEDQMQPRQHLIDRRRPAGRSCFATRTLFALRPGLSLRVRARRVCLARRACPVALVCRARRRTRAARDAPADRDVPARLLAGRSLSSLPAGRIVCHLNTADNQNLFLPDVRRWQQLRSRLAINRSTSFEIGAGRV
jgi:hypothetical protein